MTTNRSPEPGDRPARKPLSMTVSEMRRGIALQAIRNHRPAITSIKDVGTIPRVAGWAPHILQAAIDDLIAAGEIAEDAYGHLIVVPRIDHGEAA